MKFHFYLSLLCLLLGAPVGQAAPRSLAYPVRSAAELFGRDFLRVALVAESIDAMSGRLAYHMDSIPDSECTFQGGCQAAFAAYANPVALAARALGARARQYYNNGQPNSATYAAAMNELRVNFFNPLARAQYNFLMAIRASRHPLQMGDPSYEADRYCSYLFDQYAMLMHMILICPPEAALAGGHGGDD